MQKIKVDRDNCGRFTAGNQYGTKRRSFAYLLVNSVSKIEFKKIVKNLVEIAQDNGRPAQAIKAAELLFNRICGKLPEAIEFEETPETNLSIAQLKKQMLDRLSQLEDK